MLATTVSIKKYTHALTAWDIMSKNAIIEPNVNYDCLQRNGKSTMKYHATGIFLYSCGNKIKGGDSIFFYSNRYLNC